MRLRIYRAGQYGNMVTVVAHRRDGPCDDSRVIRLQEARAFLDAAFARGMINACDPRALPKYAWAVDEEGEACEAKLGRDGYHGYRLGEDE